MIKSNQEGYQTLGWIINQSEQGLFLVIADEVMQEEIVRIYRQGTVEIYDYKKHPSDYLFRDLQMWVNTLPEIQVFIIANFHLAVQDKESLNRLNFSRDMLESLGKNFIFLTTPYGDEQLSVGAYDFYSFIKLKITFHNDYEIELEKKKESIFVVNESEEKEKWEGETLKQKLEETHILVKQARGEKEKKHYEESEKLLLKALESSQELLGIEHLEIAEIDYELAEMYETQCNYKKAKEFYKKGLGIYKRILGENHPNTINSYNNLAGMYTRQGKYQKAENLYKKGLEIRKKILGKNHSEIADNYNNLAYVYVRQEKYKEAENLYKKGLKIHKKILRKNHSNIAIIYNNLAELYKIQGKLKISLDYFLKSYRILFLKFGLQHSDTQIIYKNMEATYFEWNPKGDFNQWLEEKMQEDEQE